MSLDVRVIPPPGAPDVREPIHSMGNSTDNVRGAVSSHGYGRLEDLSVDQALTALDLVIRDIDRGVDGTYTTDYWVIRAGPSILETYRRDTWQFLSQVFPGVSLEEGYARHQRERLRQDAVRFWLYLKAGYTLEWTP